MSVHRSLVAMAMMAAIVHALPDAQPKPKELRTADDIADRKAKNAAKRARRAARNKP